MKALDSCFVTSSSEETQAAGFLLGQSIQSRALIACFGDLGAGKTVFIKGLVHGAIGVNPLEINSPTFTYLNIYSGANGSAYHFDLYRLKGADQFKALGFEEYFAIDGLTCLEWAEKVEEILPFDAIRIKFSHTGDYKRQIEIVQK